jgi:hypothetical protein
MTDFSTFMMQANLVGGVWVGTDSGKAIDVVNPTIGVLADTIPTGARRLRALEIRQHCGDQLR